MLRISCIVSVEPPCSASPPPSASLNAARAIPSGSIPPWLQNRRSSIATVARLRISGSRLPVDDRAEDVGVDEAQPRAVGGEHLRDLAGIAGVELVDVRRRVGDGDDPSHDSEDADREHRDEPRHRTRAAPVLGAIRGAGGAVVVRVGSSWGSFGSLPPGSCKRQRAVKWDSPEYGSVRTFRRRSCSTRSGRWWRSSRPHRRLRAELAERLGIAVSERQAAQAIAAEIRYYRAHLDEGRDRASLEELRGRCAEALRAALPAARMRSGRYPTGASQRRCSPRCTSRRSRTSARR